MVTLTNEGTHMKLESSGSTNEPQFIPLNAVYVRVSGDNVIMRWVSSIKGANNEAVINYNDVTSPSVTSAEDLADQIMEWATSLASGGYDSSTGRILVSNDTESQFHYTDLVHILDQADDAVATYYYTPEIFCSSYKNFFFHLRATTSGTNTTFRIFRTGNPDAATPTAGSAPSSDWEDVTNNLFGSATITINGASRTFSVKDEMPYKYVISYDIDNATNTTDVWVRKY